MASHRFTYLENVAKHVITSVSLDLEWEVIKISGLIHQRKHQSQILGPTGLHGLSARVSVGEEEGAV